MRWSHAFIPTLRDDPADAEAVSHRLLVRAGFIRRLHAGHYSMLPLGQRVRGKIDRIIREEQDRIGGQQFHLPALHPAELWKKSGRWDVMGDELFRVVDRREVENALGMTHEEVFASLATEVTSYRQLPQIWYQVQTKFRDEPRPKSGLLRVREFTMKDAYTLDIDTEGLDAAFIKQHGAYTRTFSRFGLDAVDVEASSGAMGGTESIEFMVPSEAGEDWILTCNTCDYRANRERATSRLDLIEDPNEVVEPEQFDTPGIRTIAALEAAFPEEANADRQIKTLVYVVDGDPVLVCMRGDHTLHDQKLVDSLQTIDIRPAEEAEIRGWLGADPGSLGAVGVTGYRVVADEALRGRKGLVTGANSDDVHLRNVDMERDIDVSNWYDLRTIDNGETCPKDGGTLSLWKGIEIGHIFKLGTKYSEVMGAMVQDPDGASHPIVMGSYGIGLERSMAAVVEVHNDDKGIIWPVSVAPYEVIVTAIRPKDDQVSTALDRLETDLGEKGIETLIDDRDERPGVKFADAELIGVPYRITVGPRGLADGKVETQERASGMSEDVPIEDVVEWIVTRVESGRRVGE